MDRSSVEGVLSSLAATPPSSLPAAFREAVSATAALQSRQKTDLAASYPSIPRPTGVPRRGEHQPDKTELKPGEAPEVSPEGGRTGLPPEVKHDLPASAVPGTGQRANYREPATTEDDSSWWSWLWDKVRDFISRLPERDGELSTSAGPRPKVDLSGEADPAQNARNVQTADREVTARQRDADTATTRTFGETEIYPTVPEEMLSPNYVPGPPEPLDLSGPVMPDAPAEVQAMFDANNASAIRQRLEEEKARERAANDIYMQQSVEIPLQGDAQITAENELIRAEQEAMQNEARADVDAQRTRWRAENQKIRDGLYKDADAKRREADRQIDLKVTDAEQRSRDKLAEAERNAEEKRIKAEEKAAEERRKARNRPRGFWGRLKGAVNDAFDAIQSVVNGIFDALRAAVKVLIEAAKAVVRGIIELARKAIVGLIAGFGMVLKGLVSIALFAFPKAAAAARRWIDNRVNWATTAVNDAAERLKAATDMILDWVGMSLDFALSVWQWSVNFALDAARFVVNLTIDGVELLTRLWRMRDQVGPVLTKLQELIEDPTPVLDEIKAYFAAKVAEVPGNARAIARQAVTFSDPPEETWACIWFYLTQNVNYLLENWWEVIKQTGWKMLWPLPGMWDDLVAIWDNLSKGIDHALNLELSKALDCVISIMRHWVGMWGRLYGWIFIGLVIGYAIVGGIAAVEVGVVPGVIAGAAAGAAIAGEIGIALLAAAVAVEVAAIAKSSYDLIFGENPPEDDHEDCKQVANSAFMIALSAALYLLGAAVSRIAGWVVQKVAARVWRRPARSNQRDASGRRVQGRGEIIEFRVALSEAVLAIIQRRALSWLEMIRRNWPGIDLLKGGVVRRIPAAARGRSPRTGRKYTTDAWETVGGEVIQVKSTGLAQAEAIAAITGWVDDVATFSGKGNVTCTNPTSRTLIVATENTIDDVGMAALRTHAESAGVNLRVTTALPPNHPSLVFLEQIPAILAEAGLIGADEVIEQEEE